MFEYVLVFVNLFPKKTEEEKKREEEREREKQDNTTMLK